MLRPTQRACSPHYPRRDRFCRVARAARSGRALNFFVSGLRPAATYGAEIIGAAPSALRSLRQFAAHAMRPRAKGRSLTAVSLIHGDPAGRPGYSAASRWALGAWRSAERDADVLSIPYLVNAFHTRLPDALAATWRTAKGPIAIAHLELARVGWTWPSPFEFADAAGRSYHIFHASPKTIGHLLHRATLDSLAEKLARSTDTRRALYEPVCRMIRSGAFSPQQRGIIATVFAGAVWTRDRLRAAGYDAPPECELCGPTHGLADSLHHRLWACPHPNAVAAIAHAQCPPAITRDALASDPTDALSVFTAARGIVDPSDLPLPS